MSTVIRIKGMRFQVLSGDHEPPHCHVFYQDAEAKVRLDTFETIEAWGFSQKSLRAIERLVKRHQGVLLAKWEEYYGKEKDEE